MKKLFAIGTGPGASDLLTIKAVRSMQVADVIFAPNNKGKNMALDTVYEYVKGKKIVMLDFPMGNMTDELYVTNLKIIYDNIGENGTGAFVTIGDATIYSTFVNTLAHSEFDDLNIELIPGIPAFLAGANEVKMPLTLKDEMFVLCDNFKPEILQFTNSVVILKTFKEKAHILDALESEGFEYYYVSDVSQPNQKILYEREDILSEENYMSFIIGRKYK